MLVLGGDHEARPEQLTEEERQARLRSSAHGAARSYARVVVSDDATTVLLVRPHAGMSSALRSLPDGRTGPRFAPATRSDTSFSSSTANN